MEFLECIPIIVDDDEVGYYRIETCEKASWTIVRGLATATCLKELKARTKGKLGRKFAFSFLHVIFIHPEFRNIGAAQKTIQALNSKPNHLFLFTIGEPEESLCESRETSITQEQRIGIWKRLRADVIFDRAKSGHELETYGFFCTGT